MRLFGAVVFCLFLFGCYREPSFPLEPVIEFKDIYKIILTDSFSGAKKDSVVISLAFQDGDGDMGLSNKQIEGSFKGKYNYVVRAFRSQKGVFKEIVFDPSLSGFFPILKQNSKVGPIEGTLNYGIDFLQPFTPKNDTLKFQIQVFDRAQNGSNVIETRPIVLHTLF